MRIGELSRICGCPAETIRYYEQVGLLPPAPRSANGYRDYDKEHHKLLQFILRARRLGFTQSEIRQLTALVSRKDQACPEVVEILDQQFGEVRRRISELRSMEKTLSRLMDMCHRRGARRDCPVMEELLA